MKYLFFLFSLLIFQISHSDNEYPPRFSSITDKKKYNDTQNKISETFYKKNITQEDLLINNLMDNSYIEDRNNFEFDVVKSILFEEYQFNLLNPDDREQAILKKNEKLKKLNDQTHIDNFLKFNFDTNRFYHKEVEDSDNDNRHLPQYINPNDLRDNIFSYIEKGLIENVKIALDNKIDINSKNEQGQTLLMTAIIYDQINIVRFLIAKNAKLNLLDNKGLTALDYAKNSRNQVTIKLLENFAQSK